MPSTEHFHLLPDRVYHLFFAAAAAVLLSGAVPPLTPVHTPAIPGPGELVINEIYFDPSPPHVEFVELYNRSDRPLDLTSIAVADDRQLPSRIEAGSAVLRSGEFAVLAADDGAFETDFPELTVHRAAPWPQLNNTGDAVLLYAGKTLLDSVRYDPGWGRENVSLERVDPAGLSSDADNWRSSTADAGFTPGRPNSVYAPDTTPPRLLFAEEIRPQAVLLHFDEPIAPPDADVLISCGAQTGETAIVQTDHPHRLRLQLPAAPTAPECTVGGVRDFPGNSMARTSVPLAHLPKSGQLAITEIMYEPLADPFDDRPDQPEYVELYNRSETSLSIRRMYWTNRPDEHRTADTTWIGRPLTAVPANGYAVAYADPDRTEGLSIRQAFPGATPPVRWLPVFRRSLNLRNDGRTIRLFGGDDSLLDELRYSPDWHHPDLVERRGIALERIAIDAPSDAASNWSSSTAPAGGTPGRPNSITLPVTIPPRTESVQISPSPFSPDGDGHHDYTRIEYRLSTPIVSLRVRIFDARGRLVRSLLEARLTGAEGTILWDGRDDRSRPLPSGIYIVLLETVDASGGTAERYRTPVVVVRSS